MPVAHLEYQWPGGPVEGTFTARYGPDNTYLDSFAMRAESPEELQPMLERAVARFNTIFERALAEGKLKPDPTLDLGSVEAEPALQRLIEIGRTALARERAAAAAREQAATQEAAGETPAAPDQPEQPVQATTYSVQFATPDAGAFDASLAGVRAAPGVRGTAVTSTAIGGSSVMAVTFAGTLDQLAAALRARGFAVRQSGNSLAISR